MYQEIKEYFTQRGKTDLLSNCVKKIHHTDKGIELFCGSNSEIVTEVVNIIEEGICDGALRGAEGISLESGKGLSTWIYINKTKEEEQQ